MDETPESEPKSGFNFLYLLPLVVVIGIVGIFALAFTRENPNELPSALLGQTVPTANLTDLRSDPAPTDADFNADNIKLVNFWASWCGPCRAEAPILERMAHEMNIPIIGINYKDQPSQALQFLESYGDPFIKIGADFSGRNAIEWGVTGVPETFVVDQHGTILLRYPGPITEAILTKRILPLLNGESG